MTGPWMPTSPCTPGCLPRPGDHTGPERFRRALRGTVRGALLVVVVLVGAVAALLVPLLGPGGLAVLQRRWALGVLAACGVRLRVTAPVRAPEAGGGLLVVANHVSWLDVLALYAVAPVRLLAKKEVRGWPVVGAMAVRAGTVFLDRQRLRALPSTVAELAGVVRDGGAVGVFPEGTTRCGRALGTFRPAAFQAAIDAGVAVVPVAVRYDAGQAAFVGDDTLLSSLGRVLAEPGIELTLDVLTPEAAEPPCAADTRAAVTARRRELARRCEQVIGAALGGGVPVPVAPRPARPVRPARPPEVLDRVA